VRRLLSERPVKAMRGLLRVGPQDFAGRVRLECRKVCPIDKVRRTLDRVGKLRPIFDSLKNWIVDIQGVTKEQNGLGTTFSSPVVL